MQGIIIVLGSALIASLIAILFYTLCAKLWSVDVIKGTGSLLTQADRNAFLPGFLFHFFACFMLSLIYMVAFHIVPIPSGRDLAVVYGAIGMGLGFNLGMIVSILVGVVMRRNDNQIHRDNAIFIGMLCCAGHVINGTMVGAIYAFMSSTLLLG